MKKILSIILLMLVMIITGCGDEEVAEKVQEPQIIHVPADELQELFLKVTPKTTLEEFKKYVANTKLYLNEDRYDFKVAFRESDARFKYGTSGDYLIVYFNKDWTLSHTQYYRNETSCEAFMISGNTPEDKAEYYVESIYDRNKKENCVAAVTALHSAVNYNAYKVEKK